MAIHWEDYIEKRKDVMMGKLVFKGTRLTVEHILQEMGSGMTEADLLDNYPTLRPEHIRAAMFLAADLLGHPSWWPVWPGLTACDRAEP